MIRIQQALWVPLFAIATTLSVMAQDSIPWITDLSQARQIAEQQQRLVLLHFWGDGCAPCQHLENSVFNQPELIRAISSNFVPVKIHVQQQPNVASFYKIEKIPTDIVVMPSGVQVFRTTSPGNANNYIAMLDQVRANAISKGFQEVDRVAQNVDRFAQNVDQAAQNVAQQIPPMAANLTGSARDVAVTAQAMLPTWRSAPNASSSSPEMARQDSARGTVVNNEFVGPLDRKTQTTPSPASPAAPTGPRYGNPYVNETAPSPAAPANGALTAQASAVAEPAPALAQTPNPVDRRENMYASPPGPQDNSYATAAAPTTPPPGLSPNPNWTAQQQQQPAPTSQSVPPQMSQPGVQPPPAAMPQQLAMQLPPGSPPLALDGFCVVTLMNFGKWEKGDPRFGAVHRERTYLFKSQIERDRFLAPAAADRFAPVLSGIDPVRFVESGQAVHGRREHGVLFDGQIFLFADEEALVRFEQQPQRYVAVVRQAMANPRNMPPQR